MKKILFLIVIAGLFSITAQAQIRFGVKGGVNISGVSGDNISDFVDNNVTGFHIGPTIEWLVNGQIGAEGSVLYSEKGIKFKGDDTHRTGYIEVPVSLKYRFPLEGAVKPYLSAGPYISFRVSGDDTFGAIRDGIEDQWKAKSFGAGLNFGAGVELFKFVQVGANYGLGLSDNYKLSDGNYSVKERVWSITTGVYF